MNCHPVYDPSRVGWGEKLPAHWSIEPLKFHLLKVEQGWSPQSDSFQADENEWGVLKVGAVNEWQFNPNENKRLPADLVPLTEYEIQQGDILISRANTPELVGSASLVKQVRPKLLLCDKLYRLKIDNTTLDPEYLVFLLRSSIIRHEFESDATGASSSMQNISQEAVKNLFIPLPPLPEQRSIAQYLDRQTAKIDTLITKKQNLLKLLSEKRRALIRDAVTHGLASNPSLKRVDIPWLDGIPSHWNVELGKYLFTQLDLPVRDKDEIVTCFRDGQVTLRRNRREEGFTNAILELGYQGIRSGQLVLHSMDAFAGAIGVSDSDGKCSPEYIICDPISSNVFNPYYGYLLREMALQGFIQASCPAVRERAPRIRFSDFAVMLLPVPPLEEQQAIVSHIQLKTGIIDELIEAATKTVGFLQERRIALISAAVTGQIRIPA